MPRIEIDFTKFDAKMNKVMDDWGSVLKREMVTRAPKEYGTMAASIKSKVEQPFVSTSKVNGVIATGTHGTPYAVHVEYGTDTMKAAHGEHTISPPVTNWEALRKRGEVGSGQTMPFARTSSFVTLNERMGVLKEAFN